MGNQDLISKYKMTKQDYARMEELKNEKSDRKNMTTVDMYISLMAQQKSILIYVEQTASHDEEADYDELAKQQEDAQEKFDDYRTLLRETMKEKNPFVLREYLDLLKKQTDEKYRANPSKLYVPQHERMEFGPEKMSELIDKRDLFAQQQTITCAKTLAIYVLASLEDEKQKQPEEPKHEFIDGKKLAEGRDPELNGGTGKIEIYPRTK